MSNVKDVTDGTFKTEVLDANIPVLVDFWAQWCGPCRMMAPVLEEVSVKLGGKVKVLKLNVDENPSNSAKYGISAIPCMIIFKDGKEVDRVVGVTSGKELEKKLLTQI